MGHSRRCSASLVAAATVLLALPLAAQNAEDTSPAAPARTSVQLQEPGGAAQPPEAITLADAIARARKFDSQYLGAVADAKNAQEDALQSRNAMLPQVSAASQFLGTEGYGAGPNKPTIGRFVTQDGVHVYATGAGQRRVPRPAPISGWAS